MVSNVSTANQRLDELSKNAVADLSSFKPLASAIQIGLDDLGESTENILFEKEIEMLEDLHGKDSQIIGELLRSATQVISQEDLWHT